MTALLLMSEVSELTGIPVETLRTWRKNQQGPKAARIGKRVMYRRADVEAWIDQQFAESA